MLFYSIQEIAIMLVAAIVIDWLIGDPRWITHPVIYMGRLIHLLEKQLRTMKALARVEKLSGIFLCFLTIVFCGSLMWVILGICNNIHPRLGNVVNTWFISTTIAIKGLKVDAVVSPLIYALLGGAPLAILYRASNTLDSMVGYKNESYLHFG
jgi:adenosylcobinamide-phosphate synthase